MADMDTTHDLFTFDPDGDTIITLTNSDGGPMQDFPELEEARYLVSSTQLRATSSFWDKRFSSNSPETIPSPADERFHFRVYDLSPRAMWIAMHYVHFDTDVTPLVPTLSIIAAVYTITKLYGLQRVLLAPVMTMADRRGAHLKEEAACSHWKEVRPYSLEYGFGRIHWLFPAWRLKDWSTFRSLAVLIMGKSTNKIDFVDHPFPANIKAKLNRNRGSAIGHLLSHMRRLLQRLTEGLEGCSEACNAMLLGSLLRGLHRAGLVGRVQGGPDTTEGLSFEQVLDAVEYIKTAPWYDGEGQGKQHPCRLADLIDPVLEEAQECLQLEAADFDMDE